MSYIWRGLGSVAVLLTLLLVINTLRQSPQARASAAPADGPAIDERAVADHLAQAIRIATVSHQDPRQDDPTVFASFRDFLERSYPKVHATLSRELIARDALLYRWAGRDAQAAPLLFLAHQDVVPVEPGSESRWSHPPFDGAIAGGFVWGRGAIDDKGSLICLLEAVEALLTENWQPSRTIYFAFGHDEEVGGSLGAKQIASALKQRGLRFSWVLDEGGSITQGVVPDLQRPLASISVSEKGYLSLELISHSDGGHSSSPPRDTAIGMLSKAIDRLQQRQFEPRLLPTVRQSLETVAPELPFLRRLLLSNLWLTGSLAAGMLADQRETAPNVRTTIAPTMLQAGVKENVLPSSASAVVNFRILPGDSSAQVIEHVHKAIADARIEIKPLVRTRSEPTSLSPTDSEGFKLLRAAALNYFPDAIVAPGLTTGATDARHYQIVSDNVYRFVPRLLDKTDLKRVHGTDERASIASLPLMVQAYRYLMQSGAGTRSTQ